MKAWGTVLANEAYDLGIAESRSGSSTAWPKRRRRSRQLGTALDVTAANRGRPDRATTRARVASACWRHSGQMQPFSEEYMFARPV